MASNINQAIYKLVKRAEKQDLKHLVETFVDVGPLFTLLKNRDHQIIYGRRGTGKTHALNYLISDLVKDNQVPIYIDMRNIGSNGGIYTDLKLSITERATRLLIDTYAVIHDQILAYVLSNDEVYDLSKFGPLLDELAASISEIEVVGQIECIIR
jgi:Cdc6-like AAA superfamily ATPase